MTRALICFLVFVFGAEVSGVTAQTCTEELKRCRDKVHKSKQDPCTNLAMWVNCVSSKGDYCELEETDRVTFKSLQTVAKDSCASFAPLLVCTYLQTCFKEKTRFLALLPDSYVDILNDTIRTEFWCSVIEGPLQCVITNAKACDLEGSTVNSINQHLRKTKQVCEQSGGGAGTIREGTLTTVLLLVAGPLILPPIFA